MLSLPQAGTFFPGAPSWDFWFVCCCCFCLFLPLCHLFPGNSKFGPWYLQLKVGFWCVQSHARRFDPHRPGRLLLVLHIMLTDLWVQDLADGPTVAWGYCRHEGYLDCTSASAAGITTGFFCFTSRAKALEKKRFCQASRTHPSSQRSKQEVFKLIDLPQTKRFGLAFLTSLFPCLFCCCNSLDLGSAGINPKPLRGPVRLN